MDRLLHLLRSLGPAGATANAHQQLARRAQEDFTVRSLARRLDGRPADAAASAVRRAA